MATTYKPGALITNSTNSEPAALGCFAKVGSDPVLLSAAHVLFADTDIASAPGLGIYFEHYSSCCGGGEKLATTLGAWKSGFRPISGQNNVYDTESAIAKLEKGISYSNDIPNIGMITGTAPLPPASWVMNDLSLVPPPEKMLRMFSPKHGGLRYGTLFHLGAHPAGSPVSNGPFQDASDAKKNILPTGNQLGVMPRLLPNPGETEATYAARYAQMVARGETLTFSEEDDSGSIVVDNVPGGIKVIGLLSRRYPASAIIANLKQQNVPIPVSLQCVQGVGIVTPIDNVLQQMGITIPANLSGTVPASGAPAYVVPRLLDRADIEDIEGALARLKRRLAQTRHGGLAAAKLDEHRVEAQRLVNTVRPVSVTWQRYRGPAFIQHAIKNLRDPAHRIPLTIDGATLEGLLTHMRAILARHGSTALRRDLARYGDFAVATLAGVSDLSVLLAALEPRGLEPA
jgi:hypothetical protein